MHAIARGWCGTAALSLALSATAGFAWIEDGARADGGEGERFAPGVVLLRLREGGEIPPIDGMRAAAPIFPATPPRSAGERPGLAAARGRLERWRRISLEPGGDPVRVIEEMRARAATDPSFPVEGAELDLLVRAQEIPNDPDFPLQYALHNTGQTGGIAGADADAPEAWDFEKGSADVLIAVVDTGVDWAHPDLCDRIWQNTGEDADGDGRTLELVGGEWRLDPGDLDGTDGDGNGFVDDLVGWDFCNGDNSPMDDYFHGTHCAGIAAASMGNGAGIAGMAPGCRILPVKFLDSTGTGSCGEAALAIRYAADRGARVISNSWGGASCGVVLDAIEYAHESGAITVFAAGNAGSSAPFYPAAYEPALAVASTDDGDLKSGFSNYGTWVDICAPGEGIWSTMPDGKYGFLSGTSMATPLVAGAAALLLSHRPGMGPDEARGQLVGKADSIDTRNPGYAGLLGGGRVNAFRAIGELPTPRPTPTPTPTPIPHGAVVLNGSSFGPGDAFAAVFRLDRSVKQMFAAYAVIGLPDGTMLDATSLTPHIRAIAERMPALGAPFEYTLLSTAVPGNAPRGGYKVTVAFFDPSGPVRGRGDAFFSSAAAFEIE